MNLRSWRTIDIVIASVIGVAFSVVFWAWNQLYVGPAANIPQPAEALIYGVWLVPAVLGALIVRKPGAALYCELLAAFLSALLGAEWWTVTLQGLLQGLAAEAVFAIVAYRVFNLVTAVLAAAAAGLAAAVFDFFVWNVDYHLGVRLTIGVFAVLSAAVVAGVGSWALTRALAGTGVLDRFPAGRERAAV
jgi:energy-coupling factor transport system substrate-specific component